jgi:hypothetical protein
LIINYITCIINEESKGDLVMKNTHKNTINMTLSIPVHLSHRMHKSLERGLISKFTAEAIEKALDELEKKRELELEAMFESAAKDESTNQESREWMESDNLNEIEGWEWYDEEQG